MVGDSGNTARLKCRTSDEFGDVSGFFKFAAKIHVQGHINSNEILVIVLTFSYIYGPYLICKCICTFTCRNLSHSLIFLAHLSRRLTGELIVYPTPASVRRPSVVHNFKDLLL